MKSIKETAEEHLRENNITQYEYKSYIEGAGFGANYVLECIERKMLSCKVFSQSQLRLIMKFCEQLETTNK